MDNPRPSRIVWQPDSAGEACDLSGHFWAVLRSTEVDERTVWSWMILGYENQVMAYGEAGDSTAAKCLVETWDEWVCGEEAVLDSTDNPVAIADDITAYHGAFSQGDSHRPLIGMTAIHCQRQRRALARRWTPMTA